jgi:hypothetical protein
MKRLIIIIAVLLLTGTVVYAGHGGHHRGHHKSIGGGGSDWSPSGPTYGPPYNELGRIDFDKYQRPSTVPSIFDLSDQINKRYGR